MLQGGLIKLKYYFKQAILYVVLVVFASLLLMIKIIMAFMIFLSGVLM